MINENERKSIANLVAYAEKLSERERWLLVGKGEILADIYGEGDKSKGDGN